jgi:hypothetical protein
LTNLQAAQSELFAQRFDRKRPWMIGQRDLIAGHRRSHRKHGLHRLFRRLFLAQISLDRIGQRRIVVERVDVSRACVAARPHQ